jgi:hypothetical protein
VYEIDKGTFTLETPTVQKWFGELNARQFRRFAKVFRDVEKGMRTRTPRIRCECDCPEGAFAYTRRVQVLLGPKPWPRFTALKFEGVILCPQFFRESAVKQIPMYFHELTHVYAGTDDHGYWVEQQEKYMLAGEVQELTQRQLLRNADTYRWLLIDALPTLFPGLPQEPPSEP